jgi:hypothetical protein
MIPAPWLESLATRVKLHRSEWRIIALVLATPRPVTAGELAKRLKVDYSALKRLTRELVRWRILRRSYRRGDPPPWLPKEVLPPSAQAAATPEVTAPTEPTREPDLVPMEGPPEGPFSR